MKNGFYWIMGCKDNPEGVQMALENKYIATSAFDFGNPSLCFFGIEGDDCNCMSAENSELENAIIEAIKAYGTELKPVPKDKPIKEETFKPFDRIVGRTVEYLVNGDIWRIDYFDYQSSFDSCEGMSGYLYKEIHHYEDWMQKYVGSSTPFDEWVKDE